MQEPHTQSPLQWSAVFRLVRWPNLLIIIFIQICAHSLCNVGVMDRSLLVVLLTVLASAGGYVINDILDQETDKLNERNNVLNTTGMSRSQAYAIYWYILIAGMFVTGILATTVSLHFLWFYPAIVIGLWFYSRYLKGIAVLGNLLISILCAIAIPVVCFPGVISYAILFLSAFAFIVTWIREIVKDIEDLPGDMATGYHTLPIIAGVGVARIFAILLILITLTWLKLFWDIYEIREILPSMILLFTTGILLICAGVLLILRSDVPQDLHRTSNILKISMLTGTLCFVFL